VNHTTDKRLAWMRGKRQAEGGEVVRVHGCVDGFVGPAAAGPEPPVRGASGTEVWVGT
jgi:hypothetical protein